MATSPSVEKDQEQIKEVLVCQICCEHYSKLRPAKVLTCPHTFCSVCIAKSASVETPGGCSRFTCYVCRRPTVLPKGDAELLSTNLSLMHVCEILLQQPLVPSGGKLKSPVPSRPPALNPSMSTPSLPLHEQSPQRIKPTRRYSCDVTSSRHVPVAQGTTPILPPRTVFSSNDPRRKSSPQHGATFPRHASMHKKEDKLKFDEEKPEQGRPVLTSQSVKPGGPAKQICPSAPVLSPSSEPDTTHPVQQRPHSVYQASGLSPPSAMAVRLSPLAETTWRNPENLLPTPPKPPPRKSLPGPAMPFSHSFGQWSPNKLQTSTFQEPAYITSSEDGHVAVVDKQAQTIQVFTGTGQYLSMFTVIGPISACFLRTDRLAVATHHGIKIHNIAGELQSSLQTGPCVVVKPYGHAFLTASHTSIQVYSQLHNLQKELKKAKQDTGHLFRPKKLFRFNKIKDLSISNEKNIVVLDIGAMKIFIMDANGDAKVTFDLSQMFPQEPIKPECVTTDRLGNIYVTDSMNHRVLKLTPGSRLPQTVLSFKGDHGKCDLEPYGIVITPQQELMVTLMGLVGGCLTS